MDVNAIFPKKNSNSCLRKLGGHYSYLADENNPEGPGNML